jgi:ADP-L-glycero-D-manno-heptose 6-epimerase
MKINGKAWLTRYADYLDKSELNGFLEGKPKINNVIHMGAISATTERDLNKLVQKIFAKANSCGIDAQKNKVPFLYASLAATF